MVSCGANHFVTFLNFMFLRFTHVGNMTSSFILIACYMIFQFNSILTVTLCLKWWERIFCQDLSSNDWLRLSSSYTKFMLLFQKNSWLLKVEDDWKLQNLYTKSCQATGQGKKKSLHSHHWLYILFFFFKILFAYFQREGKGGRKRGQKHQCERERHTSS